jgi:hypothetical protein
VPAAAGESADVALVAAHVDDVGVALDALEQLVAVAVQDFGLPEKDVLPLSLVYTSSKNGSVFCFRQNFLGKLLLPSVRFSKMALHIFRSKTQKSYLRYFLTGKCRRPPNHQIFSHLNSYSM